MPRRSPPQEALPMPRQPRLTTAEPEAVYEAVLVLRRKGCAVYRSGAHHHVVDGQRRTDRWLLAAATESDKRTPQRTVAARTPSTRPEPAGSPQLDLGL